MKRNSTKQKWIGWMLFLFTIAFFCLQIGYLIVHDRFQVEYIDNRLFYMINIVCVACLFLANILLLRITKRFKIIGSSIIFLFIAVHVVLLVDSNKQVNNITSVSPDFKHVLSIKKNVESGSAVYYRSYFGILARPKDSLPAEIIGDFKVDWLAKDIAAVTYKTADNSIQQFIATYGDRGDGTSYYYVGAQIHGNWQGDNIKVVSNQEGISVTQANQTELFTWDTIEQFGTLAVVLKKNNEAAWTISLNENFEVDSAASQSNVGNIRLYKATLEENQPITLHYKSSN
ncbi:hypothetical protein [Virgibacillus sp. Bac332]|uniref:hypothetical protein n=1 Tax=Virgibacillus sp. Bac332 TaxID=2419842 RepID=UPI000EF54D5A|nr:hypothetical protein [Virgibacillus sp. Bac332]